MVQTSGYSQNIQRVESFTELNSRGKFHTMHVIVNFNVHSYSTYATYIAIASATTRLFFVLLNILQGISFCLPLKLKLTTMQYSGIILYTPIS